MNSTQIITIKYSKQQAARTNYVTVVQRAPSARTHTEKNRTCELNTYSHSQCAKKKRTAGIYWRLPD